MSDRMICRGAARMLVVQSSVVSTNSETLDLLSEKVASPFVSSFVTNFVGCWSHTFPQNILRRQRSFSYVEHISFTVLKLHSCYRIWKSRFRIWCFKKLLHSIRGEYLRQSCSCKTLGRSLLSLKMSKI